MFVLRKLTEKAQKAASTVSGVVSSAANAATTAASSAANAATAAASSAANAATSAASSAANVATSAAEAATSGIKNLGSKKQASKTQNDTLDEAENVSTEQKFITAIEDADVSVFMDMLLNKDELDLDIDDIEDANGLTPLRLAIAKGYSGIVVQLLKHGAYVGDALLRAVDVGFFETIKVICDYADSMKIDVKKRRILDCQCEDDDFHPDVTPIVLAAQQNDFAIVKILSDAGCKIIAVKKQGTGRRKTLAKTSLANDDLQKSVGSLEVYKGMSSEAYLIQGNEDPIDAAFLLSKKLRELGQNDVEYKPRYEELAVNVDKVGTDLISYTRSTEEILSILTHSDRTSADASDTTDEPLPKISKAIIYEQKHFVAHPNCQQAVLAKFYGKQAFLRDQSLIYKCFYLISLILGFPFLSLVYLYLPLQRVRNFIQIPYIKFTLKLASDLYFIGLLSLDAVIFQKFTNDLALKKPTKALLTIWIAGIAWQTVRVIYKQEGHKLRVFTQWRDVILVTLFMSGILMDCISHIEYIESLVPEDAKSELKRDLSLDYRMDQIDIRISPPNNLTKEPQPSWVLHRVPRAVKVRPGSDKNQEPGSGSASGSGSGIFTNEEFQIFASHEWYHPKILSNGLFALSTVLAFLRMLQYVVISDVLGPFKISLGTMVTKTAHFFVVVAIVLLSFAVGLTSLYAYYVTINSLTCGGSSNVPCTKDRFSNVFESFKFLFWSLMGLEDYEPLFLDDQAQVIREAGTMLYALFFIFVVLILLNALIAVMSEAYNNVEANADIEWKFHATSMWMTILLDDDVMPPPFNLLPSIHGIKEYLLFRERTEEELERILEENKQRNIRSKQQYKRVINKLVERFVKAKAKDESSVNHEITMTDILGLKNDIQIIKLEIFQRLFEASYHVNQSASEGSAIQKICDKTDQILAKTTDAFEDINCNLVPLVDQLKKRALAKYTEIKMIEKQISTPGLFERFVENFSTDRIKSQMSSPNIAKDIAEQGDTVIDRPIATDCNEAQNVSVNPKILNGTIVDNSTIGLGNTILQPQKEEYRKGSANEELMDRTDSDLLTEKHTDANDLIPDKFEVITTPVFSHFLMSSNSGASLGAAKAQVSNMYRRIEEADAEVNDLEDTSVNAGNSFVEWDNISLNSGNETNKSDARVEFVLPQEPEPTVNNIADTDEVKSKSGRKKFKKLKFTGFFEGTKKPELNLAFMAEGSQDDGDISNKHSEDSTLDIGQEVSAEADKARVSFSQDAPMNSKGKKSTKGLARVSFSEDGSASSKGKKSKKGLISKVKHLNKRSDKTPKVLLTKKNKLAKQESSKAITNERTNEEGDSRL